MSRNNEERTGAHEASDALPKEVTKNLDFVAPTEFVELPSRGRGYGEGHPLHGEEVVEIRFMTAKDEDILSSETLIKKGLAIERFMQNILVDKRIKTSTLLIGDRNAIIIAARRSGYGAMYETRVMCPDCGEKSQFTFDLNEPKIQESIIDEKYNISTTNKGTFIVIPPLTGYKIELRLLTGKEETHLAERMRTAKKKKQQESIISDQLRLMIVSVEGHDDQQILNTYVNNMTTQDSRYLRQAFKAITPDVRVAEDFECPSCGLEQELEVSFGADFFWPDR